MPPFPGGIFGHDRVLCMFKGIDGFCLVFHIQFQPIRFYTGTGGDEKHEVDGKEKRESGRLFVYTA